MSSNPAPTRWRAAGVAMVAGLILAMMVGRPTVGPYAGEHSPQASAAVTASAYHLTQPPVVRSPLRLAAALHLQVAAVLPAAVLLLLVFSFGFGQRSGRRRSVRTALRSPTGRGPPAMGPPR